MAPTKSHVLLAALLTVVAAVGQTPRAAEGFNIPGLGSMLNPIPVVAGVVPCSIGSSINPALVPGFPNANVQLMCGGTVVANATTSITGSFILTPVNATLGLFSSMLGGQCNVVVTTPLVACNASLAGATGTLTAPLQLLGSGTGIAGGGSSTIIATIAGQPFTIINEMIIFTTGLSSLA
ncbi:phylloplanin [Zea mays]|uniref:Phylloplanin n=1 Tax=Zea mays TaxID=4577 RepID=A0A804LK18_MAIZE|nr:phylloplanin [Zea mays]|eukprot:XP_008655466.1 phylloplanin [Zea mays]